KVEDRLRQLGLDNEVDKFVMTLNRGAENAAKEAKPIFIEAIRAMTIDDAWAILRGEDDAATQYLKRTTSGLLKEKFKPVIQRSLEQVNATKYYGDIVSRRSEEHTSELQSREKPVCRRLLEEKKQRQTETRGPTS